MDAKEKLKLISSYVERGWKLVPIPTRSKAPSGASAKGWQSRIITNPSVIGDGNVGILLGEPSDWLVDIDLDWPEAGEIAASFLPSTGAIFGRESKGASHYLYRCISARTRAFKLGKKKDEGGTIVEIRSTGNQTVFPPSIHPSGEEVSWESREPPAEIGFDDLERAAGRLAAACLAIRNWTDGARQDLTFGIAGLLLKNDWEITDVEDFIKIIAETSGDTEPGKRAATVKRTARKIESNSNTSGFSKLAEIWGDALAQAFARFLKIGDSIPPGAILTGTRSSKEIVKEAWERIKDDNDKAPTIFTFGQAIARVNHSAIEALSMDSLWQDFAARLDWVVYVGAGKIRPCDPPVPVIKYAYHQHKSEIPVPNLHGETRAPVLTSIGTVQTEPGYDPNSRLYHFHTISIPDISAKPKDRELAAATDIISEVICDFPFVHESDRAHALSMIILPFVRSLIPGPTPLYLIDKPKQGTGATLLAEVVGLIKTGSEISAIPMPRSEEELQKVLFAKLLTAPEFLFLDNVRAIYSDALAMALTSTFYESRRLGKSEVLMLPVRCEWIATGNNVEMGPDFPRRTVNVRMDANLPHPEYRTDFRHPNLKDWVRAERGKIIWAILTLARGWYASGRRKPGKSLASYDSWSDVVGGILAFAKVPGFLETATDRKDDSDPYLESEIEFVRCWLGHIVKDRRTFGMLRAARLLNLAEACELGFAASEKGKMNPEIFAHRRMRKIFGRVYAIHSFTSDREILVKVDRGMLNGNSAWQLIVLNADLTGLNPEDVYQGVMWN